MSNKLEQLECKLEKDIGILKHAGKVRKFCFEENVVSRKTVDVICGLTILKNFKVWVFSQFFRHIAYIPVGVARQTKFWIRFVEAPSIVD